MPKFEIGDLVEWANPDKAIEALIANGHLRPGGGFDEDFVRRWISNQREDVGDGPFEIASVNSRNEYTLKDITFPQPWEGYLQLHGEEDPKYRTDAEGFQTDDSAWAHGLKYV